jgi:hypothetical protein
LKSDQINEEMKPVSESGDEINGGACAREKKGGGAREGSDSKLICDEKKGKKKNPLCFVGVGINIHLHTPHRRCLSGGAGISRASVGFPPVPLRPFALRQGSRTPLPATALEIAHP